MRAALVGILTLLAGTAAADQRMDIRRSHIRLHDAEGQCWSVAFDGPEFREQTLRAAAEERFEKPSATALAQAKRPVVTVYVQPQSAMRCGEEAPESVVVRDGANATTLSKIPLQVTTEIRGNALGVSKTFGKGHAEMTFAASRALFNGSERVVYLLTSGGRRGGWRIAGEMEAVHDPAGWERGNIKDRFEAVCDPDAPRKPVAYLNLNVIATWLDTPEGPPLPADVREVAKSYTACLERLSKSPRDEFRRGAVMVLERLNR